jgi:polyhydroxybutyrate depolymerase
MFIRRYSLALSGIIVAVVLLAACARFEERAPARSAPQGEAPVATTTPTVNPRNVAVGDSLVSITSAGVARQYRQHIPPSYQQNQPIPLVINLHGYNSNAKQQENLSQMSVKADAAGFIVVYPEGLGDSQSWKFGSRSEGQADVTFIRDLIQHMSSQFSIDPKRIYVTGISNGAEMSYRLACDLADTIAAFAPVAGGYPPFNDCQAARPIPAVAFHGTADHLLPYGGKPPLLQPVHDWATSWAARNGCAPTPAITFQKKDVTGETWGNCRDGADVTLYTIAGKGHSWPGSSMPEQITTHEINATDVIWEFFAAHPKR